MNKEKLAEWKEEYLQHLREEEEIFYNNHGDEALDYYKELDSIISNIKIEAFFLWLEYKKYI